MILVVDDDKTIRLSLKLILERNGYEVTLAEGPKEAIQIVRNTPAVELVLMDMNYSRATDGEEGMTLLRQVKVFRPDVPCILMTAWGTIDLAVQGMRAGAFDFITKPWDNGVLLERIETAIKINSTSHVAQTIQTSPIVGSSLSGILATVARVAPTNAPVLITGESGTGKELIAEAIHRQSQRSNGPFVKVNLGGISTSLFESEMFGHKKGSFTDAKADRIGRFEVAKGGTIFLDEIGELPVNDLYVTTAYKTMRIGSALLKHASLIIDAPRKLFVFLPHNNQEIRVGNSEAGSISFIPSESGDTLGVLKAVVRKGSTAYLKGIRTGDYLREVNGIPINDLCTYMRMERKDEEALLKFYSPDGIEKIVLLKRTN